MFVWCAFELFEVLMITNSSTVNGILVPSSTCVAWEQFPLATDLV